MVLVIALVKNKKNNKNTFTWIDGYSEQIKQMSGEVDITFEFYPGCYSLILNVTFSYNIEEYRDIMENLTCCQPKILWPKKIYYKEFF